MAKVRAVQAARMISAAGASGPFMHSSIMHTHG
jgi:hypothetical protein